MRTDNSIPPDPPYHTAGQPGPHWAACDAAWTEIHQQRQRYDIDDEEAHLCRIDGLMDDYAELVAHAQQISEHGAEPEPTQPEDTRITKLQQALGTHWATLRDASPADRRELIRILDRTLAPAIARLNTTPAALASEIDELTAQQSEQIDTPTTATTRPEPGG